MLSARAVGRAFLRATARKIWVGHSYNSLRSDLRNKTWRETNALVLALAKHPWQWLDDFWTFLVPGKGYMSPWVLWHLVTIPRDSSVQLRGKGPAAERKSRRFFKSSTCSMLLTPWICLKSFLKAEVAASTPKFGHPCWHWSYWSLLIYWNHFHLPKVHSTSLCLLAHCLISHCSKQNLLHTRASNTF